MSYLQSFRNALKDQKFLVLDTETTGLHDGEIVQIAIIDSDANVLLDTLVKPVKPIPADATAIHGITDEMVKDAPVWAQITGHIESIVSGKLLVVYNATFDRGMMHKSQERHNLPKIEWKEIAAWYCAMEAFAEFYGEYNAYRGNYKWQKLVVAARHCNQPTDDAHDALADCLMALGVTKHMLKAESEGENESN